MTDGRIATQVVDADGGVIQTTLAAPRITVSYERKISSAHGLPEYESAVAYAAVQADTALDGSDRASAITEAFQIAKSAVFAQLGVESNVDDTGIVVEKLVAAFQATPVKRPAPPRSATGAAGPKKTTDELWAELSSNPDKFFDNRAAKASGEANPSSPDFKRKGTSEGLWVQTKDGQNNVPDGVTLP